MVVVAGEGWFTNEQCSLLNLGSDNLTNSRWMSKGWQMIPALCMYFT